MPEPEPTARTSLSELLDDPDPGEDTAVRGAPTEVLPADDPYADDRYGADRYGAGGDADEGMLDEDAYLLEPPRRIGRLTVVLLVALVFLCGFVAGVLATRAVTSAARTTTGSSVVVATAPPVPSPGS